MGKPKPLYFEENKDRFKDFNITHLIATDYKRVIGKDFWALENYQREVLMNGVQDVDPETTVLLSDTDEIPDLKDYQGQEGVFKQKLYYYYLNTFTGDYSWRGTVALKRKNILTMYGMRRSRKRMPSNGHRGWHFSTIGTVEDIIYKIESFSHQELNTPGVKERIEENRNKLLDPYNRGSVELTIEEISGPERLVKNQHRYEHLIYKRLS